MSDGAIRLCEVSLAHVKMTGTNLSSLPSNETHQTLNLVFAIESVTVISKYCQCFSVQLCLVEWKGYARIQ